MGDINKIPDSTVSEENNTIEFTSTPAVFVNPSEISTSESNTVVQDNENSSKILNDIFFLTFPKTTFQLFACKNCNERMLNCSDFKENIKDLEDGHKSIAFKLCPSCIHENLRIYHINKGM